jgi:hypothetical protein
MILVGAIFAAVTQLYPKDSTVFAATSGCHKVTITVTEGEPLPTGFYTTQQLCEGSAICNPGGVPDYTSDEPSCDQCKYGKTYVSGLNQYVCNPQPKLLPGQVCQSNLYAANSCDQCPNGTEVKQTNIGAAYVICAGLTPGQCPAGSAKNGDYCISSTCGCGGNGSSRYVFNSNDPAETYCDDWSPGSSKITAGSGYSACGNPINAGAICQASSTATDNCSSCPNGSVTKQGTAGSYKVCAPAGGEADCNSSTNRPDTCGCTDANQCSSKTCAAGAVGGATTCGGKIPAFEKCAGGGTASWDPAYNYCSQCLYGSHTASNSLGTWKECNAAPQGGTCEDNGGKCVSYCGGTASKITGTCPAGSNSICCKTLPGAECTPGVVSSCGGIAAADCSPGKTRTCSANGTWSDCTTNSKCITQSCNSLTPTQCGNTPGCRFIPITASCTGNVTDGCTPGATTQCGGLSASDCSPGKVRTCGADHNWSDCTPNGSCGGLQCANLSPSECTAAKGCNYSYGNCTPLVGDACGGANVVCQSGSCSAADQVSAGTGKCGLGNKMYCCKNTKATIGGTACGKAGQPSCDTCKNGYTFIGGYNGNICNPDPQTTCESGTKTSCGGLTTLGIPKCGSGQIQVCDNGKWSGCVTSSTCTSDTQALCTGGGNGALTGAPSCDGRPVGTVNTFGGSDSGSGKCTCTRISGTACNCVVGSGDGSGGVGSGVANITCRTTNPAACPGTHSSNPAYDQMVGGHCTTVNGQMTCLGCDFYDACAPTPAAGSCAGVVRLSPGEAQHGGFVGCNGAMNCFCGAPNNSKGRGQAYTAADGNVRCYPDAFNDSCGANSEVKVFPSPTPPLTPPPSTPPSTPPSAPPSSPPNGPVCLSLSISKQSPKKGDTVKFTCGTVNGANHYEFRIKFPDGTVQTLVATGNVSENFSVTQSGPHKAQCRICTGTDASTCQAYEAL